MVQVKRESVRNAVVDSARELFSERGYHGTTLGDIAERSGVGVSSLYSYFPSKIALFYAVIEPWQKQAFERLHARVNALGEPRDRLRCILLGIWRDMPAENIGLASSMMEALASDPSLKKPTPLLRWTEAKVMAMLATALPDNRDPAIAYELLPKLFMMAYDGFVINRRLNDLKNIENLVETMCDIMLGPHRAAKLPREVKRGAARDRAPLVTRGRSPRSRSKQLVTSST
jgi:AcrR family transcriptional regulator